MEYAIFGDVGGHFGPFKRGLKSVGVDIVNCVIPKNLTVVQVGDLVHKGPNSAMVVNLVDTMMRNNPGRWIQLAGNHELPYLSIHDAFFYRDRVDSQTAETLLKWKLEGLLLPSYAFESVSGEQYLVTHSGLTRMNYLEYGNGDALQTSLSINSQTWFTLNKRGNMFYGRGPVYKAGIFWAEGVGEVYPTWHKAPEPMPFHQIHGHSSAFLWNRDMFRFNYPAWFVDNLTIDRDNMRTVFSVDGGNFYSIDHGLERMSFTEIIKPLIIE